MEESSAAGRTTSARPPIRLLSDTARGASPRAYRVAGGPPTPQGLVSRAKDSVDSPSRGTVLLFEGLCLFKDYPSFALAKGAFALQVRGWQTLRSCEEISRGGSPHSIERRSQSNDACSQYAKACAKNPSTHHPCNLFPRETSSRFDPFPISSRS